MDRQAKRGVEIINQAYESAFSTGFERCKAMAEPHLIIAHVELLKANLLDESLKIIIADSTERFARASRYLVEPSKGDAAIHSVCEWIRKLYFE